MEPKPADDLSSFAAAAASFPLLVYDYGEQPAGNFQTVLSVADGSSRTYQVVDFLFSLLALPVATIIKMLGKGAMAGSLGNLYGSVEKLDDTYVLPGAKKSAVLRPVVVPSAASTSRSSLLLPAAQAKGFFKCSNIYGSCIYVTDTRGTTCPRCGNVMNTALTFVSPAADGSGRNDVQKASSSSSSPGAGGKGFVQGVVTYTVRDDLTVAPMSTISSMTMLNAAGVANFAALQEKTVRLGYTEGLEIVKASMQSKTVLTDVFLGKKRARAQ